MRVSGRRRRFGEGREALRFRCGDGQGRLESDGQSLQNKPTTQQQDATEATEAGELTVSSARRASRTGKIRGKREEGRGKREGRGPSAYVVPSPTKHNIDHERDL